MDTATCIQWIYNIGKVLASVKRLEHTVIDFPILKSFQYLPIFYSHVVFIASVVGIVWNCRAWDYLSVWISSIILTASYATASINHNLNAIVIACNNTSSYCYEHTIDVAHGMIMYLQSCVKSKTVEDEHETDTFLHLA